MKLRTELREDVSSSYGDTALFFGIFFFQIQKKYFEGTGLTAGMAGKSNRNRGRGEYKKKKKTPETNPFESKISLPDSDDIRKPRYNNTNDSSYFLRFYFYFINRIVFNPTFDFVPFRTNIEILLLESNRRKDNLNDQKLKLLNKN